jgi:hypothetical protein
VHVGLLCGKDAIASDRPLDLLVVGSAAIITVAFAGLALARGVAAAREGRRGKS